MKLDRKVVADTPLLCTDEALTPHVCTGVVETPPNHSVEAPVCTDEAQMPPVCTRVAETPPNFAGEAQTLPDFAGEADINYIYLVRSGIQTRGLLHLKQESYLLTFLLGEDKRVISMNKLRSKPLSPATHLGRS